MSKVKKEIVEAAVLKLMTKITSTMPTPTYKFLLGSISSLATLNNAKAIDDMLGFVADKEGYLDLDQIKTIIDGGFNASGGKVSIDLFKNNASLMSMFVKPLTLTITKEDVCELLKEIEENAIQNVRLNNEKPNEENYQISTLVLKDPQ